MTVFPLRCYARTPAAASMVVGLICLLVGCASSDADVAVTPGAGADAPIDTRYQRAVDLQVQRTFDSHQWTLGAHTLELAARELRTAPQLPDECRWGSYAASTAQDGQRMVLVEPVTMRRSYGGLVAILVDPEALRRMTDFTGGGRLVACLLNQPDPSGATVAYTPVNLPAERVSCLWLEDQGGGHFTARVLRTSENRRCTGEVVGGELRVRRLTVEEPPRPPIDPYPPTARWMWDDDAGEQFIGIRCGQAWCEIGSANFTGTQLIQTAEDVPGWGDEQLLAVVDQADGLVVSEILGRVLKAADTDKIGNAPMNPGRNYAGARVELASRTDAPVPEYQQGFYKARFGLSMGVPTTWELSKRPVHPDGPDFIQFRAVGRQRYSLVRQYPNHPRGVNVVRWSWSDDDEGTWLPCETGCCKLVGLN